MNSPINIAVNLKLDADGNPSTNPNDVIEFTQSMLYKSILEKTDMGKTAASLDVKDLTTLLGAMNNTALTSRKLDQEERSLNNGQAAVDAFNEFVKMTRGQNVYGAGEIKPAKADPYAGLELPACEINPAELSQGEHTVNVDDFIHDED